MSKYTSEVRFICENYAGLTESVGYSSTNNVIAMARSKVFDFSYPIFDENYRSVLETKILKHFYTREIGAESVGLWKLWLDARLNEIMPYYNQLYKSELIEFNPLYDVDLTRDHLRNNNGTQNETGSFSENGSNSEHDVNENTGSVNDDNWNYYSDTPQGGVNGLASLTYLTNATHNTNANSSQGLNERTGTGETHRSGDNRNSSSLNSTEDYLEHVRGKNGGASYSKMLQEYRQTFLNIDMQVINELNDLFMNLW